MQNGIELNGTESSVLDQAYDEIIDSNAHYFRCVLTGAPYGQMLNCAIQQKLEAEQGWFVANGQPVTVDSLLDSWDLHMLAFNTRVGPTLIGGDASDKMKAIYADRSPEAQAQAVTYMLTRFFYPASAMTPQGGSDALMSRSRFSRIAYDRLMAWQITTEGRQATAILLQRLAAADAWGTLTRWNEINHFNNPRSDISVRAKKNEHVARWLADPESFIDGADGKAFRHLTDWMIRFMVGIAEREYIIEIPGNSFASDVFAVHVEAIPALKVSAEAMRNKNKAIRKQNSLAWQQAEEIKLREAAIANAADKLTRYAHSRTHGKGYAMREAGPTKRVAKPKKKATSGKQSAMLKAMAGLKLNL